ncbi:MAG: hypothetical protein BWY68_00674 [bacterium ADurb.Bin400]|nr:MAG: hypothetical protein BWY68_00674 [bacterium ADurb.Bin400]
MHIEIDHSNPIALQVLQALKSVLDPELAISIVDLGLIYKIDIHNNKAVIIMTLTTMGCPLFSVMQQDIRQAALSVPEIQEAEIQLTFSPPWSPDKMSNNAKAQLGKF